MFLNNDTHPQLIKMFFHVSLNISNTLVDMHYETSDFDGPMCTDVFTCLSLHVNNNKPHNTK